MRLFLVFLLLVGTAYGQTTVRIQNNNASGWIGGTFEATSYTLETVSGQYILTVKWKSKGDATIKLATLSGFPKADFRIGCSIVGTEVSVHQPTNASYVMREGRTGTFNSTRPVSIGFSMDGTRPYAGLSISSGLNMPGTAGKLYLDTPINPYQINLRNKTAGPVAYEIRDSAGNVIGGVTLQAGEAVSAPVYAQGGNVTVREKKYGAEWNGTGIVPVEPTMPETGWPETEVAPNTPTNVTTDPGPNDLPVPPTTDPTLAPGGGLTLGGFREGVAQIVAAVQAAPGGSGSATDLAPIIERLDKPLEGQPPDMQQGLPETEFTGTASDVGRALAKVPTVPTITIPDSQSQFSFTLSVPRLNGTAINVPLVYDFTKYDTAIAIFKGLVRAVLVVWFFFLVVRSLKGAFAT